MTFFFKAFLLMTYVINPHFFFFPPIYITKRDKDKKNIIYIYIDWCVRIACIIIIFDFFSIIFQLHFLSFFKHKN